MIRSRENQGLSELSGARACRIGLRGMVPECGFGALVQDILGQELRSRLPGARVEPARIGESGEQQAMGRGADLDCLVVAAAVLPGSDLLMAPAGCPSVWLAVGVAEGLTAGQAASLRTAAARQAFISTRDEPSRQRLLAAGVEQPVVVTPDPVVLAPRLHPPELLAKRLAYLRLMGWYPDYGAPLVLEGGADLLPAVPALAKAVAGLLREHPELSVVVAPMGSAGDGEFAAALLGALDRAPSAPSARGARSAFGLPGIAGVEDRHAALQACGAFAGTSAQAALLAAAHGRPCIPLGPAPGNPDAAAGKPAAAAADPGALAADIWRCLTGGPVPKAGTAGIERLGAALDRVAEIACSRGCGSAAAALPAAEAELTLELARLATAHEARSRRMATERMVFAGHLHQAEEEIGRLRQEVTRLRADVSEAEERLAAADATAEREAGGRAAIEAELRALRATRTFRYTAELRSAYSRLRRIGALPPVAERRPEDKRVER